MAYSILYLVLLVFATLKTAVSSDCVYSIPSTSDSSSCVVYDLTEAAKDGPYSVSVKEDSKIVFNLCGDVPAPDQCSENPNAAAYLVNDDSCNILGSTADKSTYTFSAAPPDSDKGIRVVYNDGDDDVNPLYGPRAIILDLFCDKRATDTKPVLVPDSKYNTYVISWTSSQFCPVKTVEEKCNVPLYDGTWNTIRFRPKPNWYDEAKFGIFIHWGLYSVPAFKNEKYWKRLTWGLEDYVKFHNKAYGCSGVQPDVYPCVGPSFKYGDFVPKFRAELFNPDHWADIFKKSGAKFVVLTSKHHDGWCNFPSTYHWNWNSVDVGPERDLVGDLTASVRAAGLRMGLYHSLMEWYNPLYRRDADRNCTSSIFVDEILHPTMKEMVKNYKPDLIWADGPGDTPCTRLATYWKSAEFQSWLYNESPNKDTVMVNSRWGHQSMGDYETGGDRYTPRRLLPYKWESCFTIQKTSWGYDKTGALDDYWTTQELLEQLVLTVSCGGNLLLNVGPTADGLILPTFEQRLLELGQWMEVNGEAIHKSTPWRAQYDSAEQHTWYTSSKDGRFVYAISFVIPTPGEAFVLHEPVSTSSTQVTLLGYNTPLKFTSDSAGLHIMPPSLPYNTTLQYAWTYKLEAVK